MNKWIIAAGVIGLMAAAFIGGIWTGAELESDLFHSYHTPFVRCVEGTLQVVIDVDKFGEAVLKHGHTWPGACVVGGINL